ncbi:hypothetical protein IV203_029104 [Nitzschia inconspicua]|uniref:Uncharacterized protein n=1 Tax=Nitzschia inconspicua TaxID=303405 RepID=A0A9K3Q2Z7_9STRA|nr:hypothetical protein IV203_029104 [Nitzschia inconspicua]
MSPASFQYWITKCWMERSRTFGGNPSIDHLKGLHIVLINGGRHLLREAKICKDETKVFCCFGSGYSGKEFCLGGGNRCGRLGLGTISNGVTGKGEGISDSRTAISFVVGIGSFNDAASWSGSMNGKPEKPVSTVYGGRGRDGRVKSTWSFWK